ncbi:MAG: isoleucine--tRNA ligase [Deltaproteobacteria bacterium]|nr:isoleucine--tRNA ligase [Deltaproteobacteria bacterium]
MPPSDREAPGFAPVPPQLDLPRLEEGILAGWERNDVEGQSLRKGADAAAGRSAAPAFVFFDGPPFATGLPHYGHILPGTIKDIVPRYQSMRGFAVERRFGWDCHGLPIESLTEDELGVHGKAEIEAHGIENFNRACRAGVLRYTAQWRKTMRRLGRWVDFDNDYKTMDPAFMQSVWWVFRRLWDKGLIYEGHRVQPVSPALGTPLSNFEVAQGPQERDPVTRKEGHKRRQDPSVTIRFALEDEDASLWAWTTTPWTLPSNLALAVGPELDYVKVRVKDTGEVAYLEPSRLAAYQAAGKLGETELLATMKGTALAGRPYTPLFPYFAALREKDGKRLAFRVVTADYVSTDAGTGIVHQAPAFGEDDYEVGRREGLPLVNPVSLQGIFDARVTDFAGQHVKDADKGIMAMLKANGRMVDQDVIVHPYPHCYRTEQPLLYMALSTWFVKVETMRDRLVAHNDEIHWVPEHVGSGRFGNWLGGARDWNVARSRYWGTPIPIWRCDLDPDDTLCVGSIAELAELSGRAVEDITDLHRESVDGITFPSKKTPGGTMRRVADVFDCWFESGSMPYAQNGYPFDASKREYVERNLPADFIAEGLDQTRGWFYTLHVLANALFDRPAFKHVIVNGLVLAEDGKKMSKRLKNYPDPTVVIDEYGADALRAYLVSSAAVRAEPMRFSEKGVRDTVRTVILPLYNAYNFLVTYARADGWAPTAADLERAPEAKLDRWITSRLAAFVGDLQREFDAYALSNAVPALAHLRRSQQLVHPPRSSPVLARPRGWRSRQAVRVCDALPRARDDHQGDCAGDPLHDRMVVPAPAGRHRHRACGRQRAPLVVARAALVAARRGARGRGRGRARSGGSGLGGARAREAAGPSPTRDRHDRQHRCRCTRGGRIDAGRCARRAQRQAPRGCRGRQRAVPRGREGQLQGPRQAPGRPHEGRRGCDRGAGRWRDRSAAARRIDRGRRRANCDRRGDREPRGLGRTRGRGRRGHDRGAGHRAHARAAPRGAGARAGESRAEPAKGRGARGERSRGAGDCDQRRARGGSRGCGPAGVDRRRGAGDGDRARGRRGARGRARGAGRD